MIEIISYLFRNKSYFMKGTRIMAEIIDINSSGENTSVENKVPGGGKTEFAQILKYSALSKYFIIAFSAALIAVMAVFTGYEAKICIAQTLAAAMILFAVGVIQRMRLIHLGLSCKAAEQNLKSLDSRLMGSISDCSGIGSMMGALSGVASVFAEAYITDGGLFSRDNFMPYILAAAAQAVSTGALTAALTSRNDICLSLYLTAARACGKNEKEIIKKSNKITRCSELMTRLRTTASIRLTAAVALTEAIVILSLSGAGSPYTCIAMASIYAAAVVITEMTPKCKNPHSGSEKNVLWTRNARSLCAVNAVVFAVITVLFMFSFPVRSVYTEYTPVTEYYYYDAEPDSDIDPFSVPVKNEENSALYAGFYLITLLMLITTAGGANADGADFLGGYSNPCCAGAYAICFGVASAYIVVHGIYHPQSALNAQMWLVTISIGCLMLAVNIIRSLIAAKKAG